MAIGPALTSPAPINEPRSSQPRFGVTSDQGASGPGSVASCPRSPTMITPLSGDRAMSIA